MLPFLNQPRIDDVLHVVLVVSNPCLYKRRYQLARECLARLQRTAYVQVYLVELAYGNQSFALTDAKNPRHLQLRGEVPLWHKENMINLGVQRLLPPNWKAFAWIDADIEFLNPMWARQTLEVLRHRNVVQVFDTIAYLDAYKRPERTERSSLYMTRTTGVYSGHSGVAWAIRRDLYDRIGGLFQDSILGGGDGIMANAFVHKGTYVLFPSGLPEYNKQIRRYEDRCGTASIDYVPGTILHSFHGSLRNRKYVERKQVLIQYQYDPVVHMTKNSAGLLVPTKECPPGLLQDILQYFRERNEDDWETPINGDPEDPKPLADASTSASP